MFNSIVQGWINYYGRFYRSRLLYFLRRLNRHLVRWACRKYKRLKRRERRAMALAGRDRPSDLPACSRTGGSAHVLTAGRWEPDESRGSSPVLREPGGAIPPATLLIVGFAGPKAEAEQIRQRLAQFLRDDLKLELSQEKTLITHARTGAARLLGYEITVGHADRKLARGRRSVNGAIALRVPTAVIKAKCSPYLRFGKPGHRPERVSLTDHEIIGIYGSEYRGIIQYYLLAGDVWRLTCCIGSC